KPIVLALCPAIFDRHIPPFGIAVFAQSSPKRTQQGCEHVARSSIEEPDHRHRRLLRARRERPCSRAPDERDEVAPPHHSITSSASRRNDSGIVSPSAFAVLRLTVRSNLVGCSTGRSAGRVPCKILCT